MIDLRTLWVLFLVAFFLFFTGDRLQQEHVGLALINGLGDTMVAGILSAIALFILNTLYHCF